MNLDPPYDNSIEQGLADLASTVRILNPEAFDSDAEGLFAMLVRGTAIYVKAWENEGSVGSLADAVVTSADLADPNRIADPHAHFITLLELTLEAIEDNIRGELDPNWKIVKDEDGPPTQ